MRGRDRRSDGELLVATPDDPEAFAIFHSRHVRGVTAFFQRRVGSPELAFALTAETFANALDAAGRYELRPEPARTWLYGIAWTTLQRSMTKCGPIIGSSNSSPTGTKPARS
jgi:DNA-directed RNA polymerase specialized sigma24 family protein